MHKIAFLGQPMGHQGQYRPKRFIWMFWREETCIRVSSRENYKLVYNSHMRNVSKANRSLALAYNMSCNRSKRCFSRTIKGPLSLNDVKCVPLYMSATIGGRGGPDPQNLDGEFYVAFWWIKCDYVTDCTKLGRPVYFFCRRVVIP